MCRAALATFPPRCGLPSRAADVVIHAGDWVDVALLERLQGAARRLLACYGNNDGADLRARLPEVAQATLAGVRVAVVHETGGAKGREGRADRAYRRHRSAGVRPLAHSVGLDDPSGHAAAQSRLTHRPAPPALPDLPHRRTRRRSRSDGGPARPAVRLEPYPHPGPGPVAARRAVQPRRVAPPHERQVQARDGQP